MSLVIALALSDKKKRCQGKFRGLLSTVFMLQNSTVPCKQDRIPDNTPSDKVRGEARAGGLDLKRTDFNMKKNYHEKAVNMYRQNHKRRMPMGVQSISIISRIILLSIRATTTFLII